MFICIYDEECFGKGKSLKEAYDNLVENSNDEIKAEECKFYEAEEVEVEVKIQKKEVVSKINKLVNK